MNRWYLRHIHVLIRRRKRNVKMHAVCKRTAPYACLTRRVQHVYRDHRSSTPALIM